MTQFLPLMGYHSRGDLRRLAMRPETSLPAAHRRVTTSAPASVPRSANKPLGLLKAPGNCFNRAWPPTCSTTYIRHGCIADTSRRRRNAGIAHNAPLELRPRQWGAPNARGMVGAF